MKNFVLRILLIFIFSNLCGQSAEYGLAIEKFKEKEYEAALIYFNKALVKNPKDENLLCGKAKCLLELRDFTNLKIVCEDLVKANSKNVSYWRLMCRVDVELRDYDSAEATIEAMKRLNLASGEDLEILRRLKR